MLFEPLAGTASGTVQEQGVGDRFAQAMEYSNAALIPPEIVLEARLESIAAPASGDLLGRDCAFRLDGAHDDRHIDGCAFYFGDMSDAAVPTRLGAAEAVLDRAATLGAREAPRLAALNCGDAAWRHCATLARADFAELLLIVDSSGDAAAQRRNFVQGRDECARLVQRPPGWILGLSDRRQLAATPAGRAQVSALLEGLLPTVDGVYLLPLLLANEGGTDDRASGCEQLFGTLAGQLAEAGLRRTAPGLYLASDRLHRTAGAPLLMRLLASQRNGDYIGVGPLAVSRIDRMRFRNWADTSTYRYGVDAHGHGIAQSWTPTAYETLCTELIAALALGETVDLRSLAARHQLTRPACLEHLQRCSATLAELGAVRRLSTLTLYVPPASDVHFARLVATLDALRAQMDAVTLHLV
jgi:hypothetical protein